MLTLKQKLYQCTHYSQDYETYIKMCIESKRFFIFTILHVDH
jgi:hypothetical protein